MPRIHLTLPRFNWEPFNTEGPYLAKHACTVSGPYMYLHGGQDNVSQAYVKNCLWRFDFEKRKWEDITRKDSPHRAMHVLVPYFDTHLLAIGGWTGLARSVNVWSYDIEAGRWLECKTVGFPDGAGLSSHFAITLQDDSYLVMGREGSLRQQRRHGGAWYLCGSPRIGFSYRNAYFNGPLASRSSHGMAACQPDMVTVIGGRSDNLVENHSLITTGHERGQAPARVNYCSMVSDMNYLPLPEVRVTDGGPRLEDRGRAAPAVIPGKGCCLIYGGCRYVGTVKAYQATNDFLFYKLGDVTRPASLFPMPIPASVSRVNMAYCVDPKSGEAYMHGGVTGTENHICHELFKLVAYEPNTHDVKRYYELYGNEYYVFKRSTNVNKVRVARRMSHGTFSDSSTDSDLRTDVDTPSSASSRSKSKSHKKSHKS